MPSTSKKQHNFMAAVANNPKFAKKVGVPQSVGKDFNEADKGRKFSKGDDMKKMNMGGYADGGMPMKMKDGKKVPAFLNKGGMAKGKMPAALAKHAGMPASKAHKGLKAGGSVTRADGCVTKGHTKGKQITMQKGGMC